VLEAATIDTLKALGLGDRMLSEGMVDTGLDLSVKSSWQQNRHIWPSDLRQ
jgi:hypothetical protein